MPQFSERGGMIHFLREGNRVRFDVNLTATQNAGLTLSSELLKVAATVKGIALPAAEDQCADSSTIPFRTNSLR